MLKRSLDLFIATSALVLLSPLLVILSVLVRLDSPGPILFKQERVGRYGKRFCILKFRTMKHGRSPGGLQVTAVGDSRITRIGAFLRKWKLDELPQLINVLRGEMSLVGPRPEVPRYVAHYDSDQLGVLRVRPGITDPASLEFREESELLGNRSDVEAFYLEHVMPRKLELNRIYINESSLLLDLRIILATAIRVLRPNLEPSPSEEKGNRAESVQGATTE